MKKIKEIYPAPDGLEKHPWFHPTYKNLDFCIKQCKSLAKQVAKMISGKDNVQKITNKLGYE